MSDAGSIAIADFGREHSADAGVPTQPETFWTNPLVLGEDRLNRQFDVGSNGLFRLQETSQPFMSSGRWRWYDMGKKTFCLAVKTGANTLTVKLRKNSDVQPRPTVRLHANTALGYAAQSVEDTTGTVATQTLTIEFTSTADGVGSASLEHLNPTANATVDVESVELS